MKTIIYITIFIVLSTFVFLGGGPYSVIGTAYYLIEALRGGFFSRLPDFVQYGLLFIFTFAPIRWAWKRFL